MTRAAIGPRRDRAAPRSGRAAIRRTAIRRAAIGPRRTRPRFLGAGFKLRQDGGLGETLPEPDRQTGDREPASGGPLADAV